MIEQTKMNFENAWHEYHKNEKGKLRAVNIRIRNGIFYARIWFLKQQPEIFDVLKTITPTNNLGQLQLKKPT